MTGSEFISDKRGGGGAQSSGKTNDAEESVEKSVQTYVSTY